jgi:hypothetical protein
VFQGEGRKETAKYSTHSPSWNVNPHRLVNPGTRGQLCFGNAFLGLSKPRGNKFHFQWPIQLITIITNGLFGSRVTDKEEADVPQTAVPQFHAI